MDFLSTDNIQQIKLGLHIAQAFFIFISWCLMIGVFHNAFLIVGGPAWFFTLCFFSVPPIVYQTMTPRFERSRKWANPYAFAILDVIYTIFWLSAFASVAAYNSTGLCSGACPISKACVGLGFFIFLFFCLTSAISVYGVIYFKKEGILPGTSRMPSNAAMIDPDREHFSTAPHDDEYAPIHLNDKDHHDDMHHEMDGEDAGSSVSYDPTSYSGGVAETSYSGAATAGRGSGRVIYAPPTVSDAGTGYRTYGEEDLEQGDYDGGEPERVRFPAGNYN